jgi:thiamine-phosphate pyrophosphorylase
VSAEQCPTPLGSELRERLGAARLYLLFTPGLCGERDPLEVLEALLSLVDVVQVRVKAPGERSDAAATYGWTVRALELCARLGDGAPPVLVDDRVDVARALAVRGCAGVHLGQEDAPPRVARALLGADALIGLSTHDAAQVARAGDEPVDYLGFGPVHATATKGYARGLGSEAAWIAARATHLPLFPIGGIDTDNAGELEDVGRAVVGSALLAAPDPARAARELRALLEGEQGERHGR